jgi:methionyl-tRNA synthetase
VSVLLHPYLPTSTTKLLQTLGAPDLSLAGAAFGQGTVAKVKALEPLFPKQEAEPTGQSS